MSGFLQLSETRNDLNFFFKTPKKGGCLSPIVKCDTSNERYLPWQKTVDSDFLFFNFHNFTFPFKVGSRFSALKSVCVQPQFTGTLAEFFALFYIF